MKTTINATWATPLALSLAVSLAACGGNSSSRVPVGDGGGGDMPETPELLVMHNGADNAGEVDRLNRDLEVQSTFMADANEGIALDLVGNLYGANDSGGAPSDLQVIDLIDGRDDGTTPNVSLDRAFEAAGSMTLKGIAIAHRAGLVMAANVGGNTVEVYGTAAGEGATALASTTLPGDTWDLAYDEDADRLFLAMTNGTALVVDDYVEGGFSATGARTLTPDSAGDVSNLHGIAYLADSDTLVVTDVGDAAVADDGRLYVIENASSAEGTVTPSRTLAGDATMMGNPVDLIIDGGDAYIAEKSNDAVLVYRDVLNGDSGDIAPDQTVESIKPESLAFVTDAGDHADLSDLEDASVGIEAVAVSRNPASVDGDPDVVLLEPELGGVLRDFTVGEPIESLSFNQMGDAYLTNDDGSDDEIRVINRLAFDRDGDSPTDSRDRSIGGAGTDLGAAKGFDIADAWGRVLVADNGEPAVRVFGAQAEGDVTPVFTTDLDVAPWDLDYDPDGDRLYVALVDGTVAVFDEYSSERGAAGPDRIITPAMDGSALPTPTNLHGIVHVAGENKLIVSDVGAADNPNDGKIFVIDNADSADGLTEPSVVIDDGDNNAAGNTMLGNPVDIAFDGENLYVAEKSNDLVLRFDGILSSDGGDVSPTFSADVVKPESVALVPEYLSRAPE